LPAFHAFTGYDFNPSFYTLRNSAKIEQVFQVLEQYVCRLYNLKKIDSVNEGRLAIFSSTYEAKKSSEQFRKAIIDASCLPPCKAELENNKYEELFIQDVYKVPDPLNILKSNHF
ncbi:hypothetical protein ALC60_09361, partial [Trachymyrmex zeteki]